MTLALAATGAMIGAAAVESWHRTTAAPPANSTRNAEISALVIEIARLKELVPTQSHAMADVGYHWANLWFAAAARNWPLATFYFDEARYHVMWTIMIRPVRKDADGQPVDLKALFEGIDKGVLSTVSQAIATKDHPAFVIAYKQALEACYSCHKASGKPYLRPTIPHAPGEPPINFDGAAALPQ